MKKDTYGIELTEESEVLFIKRNKDIIAPEKALKAKVSNWKDVSFFSDGVVVCGTLWYPLL
jgi:hypothetical protein